MELERQRVLQNVVAMHHDKAQPQLGVALAWHHGTVGAAMCDVLVSQVCMHFIYNAFLSIY